MLISKTTFLEFQMCPKNTWLKLHRPELLHQFKLSEFELHLVEQGNEVESFARNLWPGGVLVALGGEGGCRETERLMSSGVPAIFQATFAADGFIAKRGTTTIDVELLKEQPENLKRYCLYKDKDATVTEAVEKLLSQTK